MGNLQIRLLQLLFFFLFISLNVFIVNQYVYSATLLDRVVATVNSEVITWSELRKTIQIENKDLLSGLSPVEKEQKINEIERSYLNSMIDIKLQLQEAVRLRIMVSSAETQNAVRDIKKKYNLTDEGLLEHLRADNLSLEEYKIRLSEQILVSKIVQYKFMDSILVSDEEIQEYLENNQERFREDEKIKIRQILFVNENGQQKAQEVMKRIQEGEDFAKLAKEFSDDSSRAFGGDLGYVSRGSVMKEIEDVAFSLKVGEISEPFLSSKGIHIIKIDDRLEGGISEQASEKIKALLFEKAYQSKYEDWLKELRENAYIEITL
jgi:parvulin-like peptidyl-prolyl isomerase